LGFPHIKALIFDMDGVLVDASMSYRAASVATVNGYVRDVLGHAEPGAEGHWVEALKRIGGFNNDWDLTSALVRGVLASGASFNIQQYADALSAHGGGLDSVDQLLGPLQSQEAIERLGPSDGLKRYFQEHYLGDALFHVAYDGPRQWYQGQAFIAREMALTTEQFLKSLPYPKGIATGRPRIEADYALARFEWRAAFGAVVTRDCVIEGGGGQKPHPWSVLEAVRLLGDVEPGDCAYIGDQPDDMHAARSAGCLAIGCAVKVEHDVLTEAGGQVLIENVNELVDVLA
jgi:HAD superfamily hydrolase (TIGR01548 family)